MKETFYQVGSWGDREWGTSRTRFFKTVESALNWIKEDSNDIIIRYSIVQEDGTSDITVKNTWPTVEELQQYGPRIIMNNGNVYTGCFRIYTCHFED